MSLPTELPRWYTVEESQEKGWTPKTEDIIQASNRPENKIIREAWYAKNNPTSTYTPSPPKKPTLKLQILTPIQVGGGSWPEGMILPAQIGGYPCIPGSSLKGSVLSWIKQSWAQMDESERTFWESLIQSNRGGWRPRAIRFESIPLNNLEPYPLNPQQPWQVFQKSNRALSIQWQACPQEPPSPNPYRLNIQVILRKTLSPEQNSWLKTRIKQALEHQGVGRGTRSGFGRLVETLPQGTWEIKLKGMKPGIQTKDAKKQINGKYRWSPQVLRANLRSWFLRLSLGQLRREDAEILTSIIFGGFGSPAKLSLVSYRVHAGRTIESQSPPSRNQSTNDYANIDRKDAEEVWSLRATCNEEYKPLIGLLLELAQRLGGLGPGWRRPPHILSFNGYRGSHFTTQTDYQELCLADLIQALNQQIQTLAGQYRLPLNRPQVTPTGGIHSIWESSNPEQWYDIVHGVCASGNTNRPSWCGSTSCPSGYSVRQQEKDYCLITAFEEGISETLSQFGFEQIWSHLML